MAASEMTPTVSVSWILRNEVISMVECPRLKTAPINRTVPIEAAVRVLLCRDCITHGSNGTGTKKQRSPHCSKLGQITFPCSLLPTSRSYLPISPRSRHNTVGRPAIPSPAYRLVDTRIWLHLRVSKSSCVRYHSRRRRQAVVHGLIKC